MRTLAAAIVTVVLCGPALPAEKERPADTPQSTVLRVGPQQKLTRPSAAAQIARDGDIVEIEAGNYDADAATWSQNGLTIRGVGGRAHLRARGAHAEGKAIWVIKGSNTTIENVEFSGAVVPDGNGAGIRQEGAGLTVRHCFFHDNQNGILTGENANSDIVIEFTEFANNGAGDGQTHGMYIARVRTFTLRFSYIHHTRVGHNVKSRALKNYIAYNRIMDENDGRSSYLVDLPNGGLSFLIGNVLQQGPETENSGMVAYGAEGYVNPVNELYVVNNTLVNDLPKIGRFISVRAGADAARIVNNIFTGPGELLSGPGELRNNLQGRRSDFVDPGRFDYRLRPGSPAIGRGIDAGSVYGLSLRPTGEYAHPARRQARSEHGKVDLGAFEYRR